MQFNSKKISLAILGATSVVCSRVMFSFIDDPEGPNLLVVVGMGAIVYFLALGTYTFYPSKKQDGPKKLLLLILIQILIVTGLYFILK